METIRKNYLSLNVFGIELSLGRNVPKEEPKKIILNQIPISKIPTPRDVASLMVEKEVLDEGKKLYKKIRKVRKYKPSYYQRKKYSEKRKWMYKNNIDGFRDRMLAYTRKQNDKRRRERAMAKALQDA